MSQRLPLVFLVIGVVGSAALYWRKTIAEPLVVSGFLESDEIRVGSRVGGRVAEVAVKEGESAPAGALLVRLEPFDLKARRDEAQARFTAAAAVVDRLKGGYRNEERLQAKAKRDVAAAILKEAVNGPRKQEIQEARDNLSLAQAEKDVAESKLQRAIELYKSKNLSKESYDEAVRMKTAATATYGAREQRLELLLEGTRPEQKAQAEAKLAEADAELLLRETGFRPEEIREAEAQKAAAQAALAAIEHQLRELDVHAPGAPGVSLPAFVVETIDLQPGDLFPANAPMVTLIDLRRMWVRAYVPEKYLNRTPLDVMVDVRVDGLPGRVFKGRVAFIAREAEFTPSNVQTPDQRSKRVFRIRVELTEGLDTLRPGMAAEFLLDGLPETGADKQ